MERLAFQEAVDFTEHSQSHWVSHEFRAKAGTEKDVQERYLRGKKWVNKKEMERLAICTCSWAARLDKWCFRKGYPPARTLKLWLHYFFFEKNFISTKKDLLLSFLKNVYFFYLFILTVLRLWLCVLLPTAFALVAASRVCSWLITGFLLWWSLFLRSTGSGIVAHEPSCLKAYGIFPDQGSNSCLLLWQVDF